MRKTIVLLLMMCGVLAVSQAELAVTNGDFEINAGPSQADVDEWFDDNTGGFWNGAWQSNDDWITANDTQVVVLTANGADAEDPLAGDSFLYQSIGISAGEPLLQVDFDWGHPDDVGAGRIDTTTVSAFYSDGSFVGADDLDIYGSADATLLGSASYTHVAEGTDGEIWPETAVLDISGAPAGSEIFLRFNSGSQWPIIDNVSVSTLSANFPYEPTATPVDPEGNIGNVVENGEVFEIHDVVLHWKGGEDPNGEYPVDPTIIGYYVYLSKDAPDDPNLFLMPGFVTQVHDADPYLSDPNNSYGPLPDDLLTQGTTYFWQVEQVMPDPNNPGQGLPAGDEDNVFGQVWSFTTASAIPSILVDPEHTLTDTAGDATLEITSNVVADGTEWYLVVGEQDSEDNEETDDVLIDNTTNGGIYSGYDTNTLVITGAASDGSNDARVYAIALNDVTPSEPSAVAWHWYPRQVNYYTFESVSVVDGNDVTPDLISGQDMTMLGDDTGDDVPGLDSNVPSAPGLTTTTSLFFNNPDIDDPNNVDAQYAQVNDPWAGAYKDITISAWVYTNSGGASWNRIYDFGTASDASTFISTNAVGGDILRFAVNPTPGAEQSVSAPADAYPLDEWVHVVATLTDDTAKLYINGEWVATNDSMTADPITNGPHTQNWVGRSAYGADPYFDGYIDELKIYNYGLTNTEVGEDYLADSQEPYVCDMENYDLENYDTNQNCLLDLPDFASMAARWLEDDRLYPLP